MIAPGFHSQFRKTIKRLVISIMLLVLPEHGAVVFSTEDTSITAGIFAAHPTRHGKRLVSSGITFEADTSVSPFSARSNDANLVHELRREDSTRRGRKRASMRSRVMRLL